MKQFVPVQGENKTSKVGIAVLCICMMLMAIMFIYPIGQTNRENARAAAEAGEAEQAEVLYRRGGVAEHIDIRDGGSLEGQEGFRLRYVTYYTYDGAGHQIAEDRYDAGGRLVDFEHDTYDGQGNLILNQSEYVDTGWDTYEETRYTYDGEDRPVLRQRFDGGRLTGESYWRYMEDGNVYSLTQSYQDSGERGSWYTQVCNGNGDKVIKYSYDAQGQVTSCEKYRYDREGRPVYYIFYDRGDESTTPLREVYTEYKAGQLTRMTYEPLGHLNAIHFLMDEGNSSTEMYYLAGYSGVNGIHILGQEEPVLNRTLKFWEGCWKTYADGLEISFLHSARDRIKSYHAYWYEDGRMSRSLDCTVNGGICNTSASTYVYNGEGLLTERYDYGYSGESLEEKLQDGTVIRLEYAKESSVQLTRLLCTDAEGNVLREITFDVEREERIEEWYEPMKEQVWAEELVLTEDGILPAAQAQDQGAEPEEHPAE